MVGVLRIIGIAGKNAPQYGEKEREGIVLISSRGRYALRVMTYLAEHSEGGYVSLRDVAARQDISRKYLEGIMAALCRHDLVQSATGKTGGYRLKRPPREYTAGEILRASEGELAPVACVAKDAQKCGRSELCPTLPFWLGLEKTVNAYIDSYTLEDLLQLKNAAPRCQCGTQDREKGE